MTGDAWEAAGDLEDTDNLEAADTGPSWLAVHCMSLRWYPTMGALPGKLDCPAHLG